jgi:hypothetical protein
MFPWMIFGGITVQIVEFELHEARRDCLEEFRRETQCMSLADQLLPHPGG